MSETEPLNIGYYKERKKEHLYTLTCGEGLWWPELNKDFILH